MAALTATELVRAREEERTRLRRELHDGVGAALAGIILCLGAAQAGLPSAKRRVLADIERDLVELGRELRLLIDARRPPALHELGLVEALHRYAARTAAGTGLRITVTEDGGTADTPLAPEAELAAYRIVTEAVMNVVRHARATRCDVALARRGAYLHLSVCDDGIGLPAAPREGVGQRAMRERAAEAGGWCVWRRGPTGGTRVHCGLPLAER
jgi:signal transduction histidine kinase